MSTDSHFVAQVCACGHDSSAHDIEPPYPCYDCPCTAFRLAAVAPPSAPPPENESLDFSLSHAREHVASFVRHRESPPETTAPTATRDWTHPKGLFPLVVDYQREVIAGEVIRKAVEHDSTMRFYLTCPVGEVAQRVVIALQDCQPVASSATPTPEPTRTSRPARTDAELLEGCRVALRSIGQEYHLVEAASRRAEKRGDTKTADALEHVYGRLRWLDFALGTMEGLDKPFTPLTTEPR